MPRKKQPKKFVASDVVEASGRKGLIRNTDLVEDLKQMGLRPAESRDKYSVDWFDGLMSIESENDLTLCKGINDTTLCGDCEYFFKCPESNFILVCHTNGKLDETLCKECEYRFKCWTTRHKS